MKTLINKIKNNPKTAIKAFILSLIVIVCSILLVKSVLTINIIPFKYTCILFGILLILDIVSIALVSTKKVWKNVIAIILIILISTLSILVSSNLNRTYNALNSIVNKHHQETNYVILIKNNEANKDIKTIKDLNNKKNGILDTDSEPLKESLNEQLKLTYIMHGNISSLIESLMYDKVDFITVSSDINEIIKEEYKEEYSKLREVGEHVVETEITNDDENIEVKAPFIIYLSGIDQPKLHSSRGRSDVNILVVVNPSTHKILLVNTPRDYYVKLHNKGPLRDKLTHAGTYGVDMSVATIEDLYGIKIDAYVKVSYGALINVVDAIDGVDIYSDMNLNLGFPVKKGMNHFNGEQALRFSRERHSYAGGDRHRGANQQQVITAIINKVSKNKKYLVKYNELLELVSPYMYTNIKLEDFQTLIKDQIDTLVGWEVESTAVTGRGASDYTYSIPSRRLYVMVPDQGSLDAAKNKIDEYLKVNE